MNFKKIVKNQVRRFLIENEDNLSKADLYTQAIEHFSIDRKTVSRYYLQLEKEGLISNINDIPPVNFSPNEVKKILQQTGDNLNVSLTLDYEIKTLDQLLAVSEVDTEKWEVVTWSCGKHDLGIKNASKQIEKTTLFSVKANFKQRTLDNDLSLQKDFLLKELYTQSPVLESAPVYEKDQKAFLLELALFDVHFGKLAHKEESGEDYDLKIAAKRYKQAISSLLDRVKLSGVERILLPIGNDMINVDNVAGLTTGGTPQDCDSRFYKIVRSVKNLLVETINMLLTIAPVDVVVCVGNHDQQTSFMIGEMLDAYYHNIDNVTIDNRASLRKYYKYGKNAFLFTHGNKERQADLGMIFAAEKPKLWGNSSNRYIQIGHFHHNKKINYINAQEFQGFQVQILPSLSSGDAWHAGKGYHSVKQAKAFLYDKAEGAIAEYTYTVQN
jgi:hypothetical protein